MANKMKVSLVLHTMQTETSGRNYTQREWDYVVPAEGDKASPLEIEMRETVLSVFPETHKPLISDMLGACTKTTLEMNGYTLSINPYSVG